MHIEEITELATRILELHEQYLVKKYGLIDIHGKGAKPTFVPASAISDSNESEVDSNPDTGGSNPVSPELTREQDQKNPVYMYDPPKKKKKADEDPREKKPESDNFWAPKESKLETQALDTLCPVGPHAGTMFRDAWCFASGESTIRILAMCQLGIAKTAAVVVKFFDQTDGEE